MRKGEAELAEALVAAGVLSRDALAAALVIQKHEARDLVDLLISENLVEERQVLRVLAEASGVKFITSDKLKAANVGAEVLDKIPARHAEKLEVLPLAFSAASNVLTIAVADPDPGVAEQVRLAARAGSVVAIVAWRNALRAGIKRFYYGDLYAFAELDAPEAQALVQPQPAGKVLAREPTGSAQKVPERPSGDFHIEVVEPEAAMKAELEQLRKENQLLRVASELHRHLSKERDVGAILHKVLAFAFDNLPADDGVLLTVDRDTGALTPRGVRTRRGDTRTVSVSETLLREVIETGEGLLTADAMSDARFSGSESVISAGLRSAMVVPLVVHAEVRALLFLDTRSRVDVFTNQDLRALMAIASQASLSLENAELSRRIAAEAATRAHLARFLSPALVEQAASGALSLSEGGETQLATILFADVRGFTSMSEKLDPKTVVALLNEHFEQMVEIVFQFGGALDKFIGDGLLALWGVPVQRPDDASNALRAALEMQRQVAERNARRKAEGRQELRIGIGVNTGPVVFGAMGSSRRQEFTAIGDAVNTASRLCDKAAPGQIVAAEDTLRLTWGGFHSRPLATMKLKGKSNELRAFEVLGERELRGK